MVMKKDLTPLRMGGQVDKRQGKGGMASSMPDRRSVQALTAPGANFGNYAKATPMAQPGPPNMPPELMRMLMGEGQ
jgi:hypothetical protein